ncbi:MFS transporter [Zoogloea sp.]|uniref:MFS transporter n=1 Tax=Zoogloea sp. TaxID=49181 RepID=UPI002611BD9F|nr:MFS transporter [Zoogloea sp.]MDD3352291.1 MFS transporter [Zoogloea sp.]
MRDERPAPPTLRYGLLGLPLAFAALPVYVHVPKLYADQPGLSLGLVGGILLATRSVDALADPFIGWASDRWLSRKILVLVALPLLALGMTGLLAPPAGAGPVWLASLLVLVTLAYSVAAINHSAWGAELGGDSDGRTRLVASREGFGLMGVVLAAALPGLLGDTLREGLAWTGWLFAAGAVLLALVCLPPLPVGERHPASAEAAWPALRRALTDRSFAALLGVFALNGIAAAVPASTVLFFVADVIQREDLAGLFLAAYFTAGAAGLPLWVRLARRLGKPLAWLAGMGLAVVVFAWAWTLGPGDVKPYLVLCVLSGLALGADLALPPALLADQLAVREAGRAGACFGWWTFVTKANLALAAGLALPLLGSLGYVPGSRDPAALSALAGVYAVLPLILKLVAGVALWRLRKSI